MPLRLSNNQLERLAFAALLALSVAAFELLPQADLWVSARFHDGVHFQGVDWAWVEAIYVGSPWVGRVLVLGALLALLGAAWRLVKLPRHWRRRAIALVVVAALGVGFLVHDVLKDSWGRPRPVATQAFGGAHPYQPALHPSDLCPRNCSFVSGHAAGGFMLLAVGMVGSRRTRWRWWAAGTAAGAVIGLARIAAGGHYLSDIVFGLLAVWGTAIVVREAWLRLAVWRRRRRLARAVA